MERSERGTNLFIENDRKRPLSAARMLKAEPQSLTVDGARCETTGFYNKMSDGNVGFEAREADGRQRPAIVMAKKDKDGKTIYGVFLQPNSVATEEAGVRPEGTTKAYRLSEAPQTAEERLNADAAAFAKQVDAFVAKKMKPQQELTVMQTPLVLQISDERVKALPVVMSQRTLAKIFRKHNLSPALVKQIPGAMADPIMVLKSEGKPGQVQDGFVVMFELRDAKGNTINVPVALNVEHYGSNGKYECNDIVSAYGCESSLTGKPYDGWFLKQAQKPGLLKYINTKKFSRWANQTRLVMPERKTNGRSIKNIPVGDESVNTKKFSRWFDDAGLDVPGRKLIKGLNSSVKSEADLVEAREKNKGVYSMKEAGTALPPITTEAIALYVPKGMSIKKLSGERILLEGPNGDAILITNRDEGIEPDPEVVKRDYGRDVQPSDVVTGRTRIVGGRAFIDMVGKRLVFCG